MADHSSKHGALTKGAVMLVTTMVNDALEKTCSLAIQLSKSADRKTIMKADVDRAWHSLTGVRQGERHLGVKLSCMDRCLRAAGASRVSKCAREALGCVASQVIQVLVKGSSSGKTPTSRLTPKNISDGMKGKWTEKLFDGSVMAGCGFTGELTDTTKPKAPKRKPCKKPAKKCAPCKKSAKKSVKKSCKKSAKKSTKKCAPCRKSAKKC